MKAKLLLILGLCLLPAIGRAQTVDSKKLNSLATAVAHAEGFGPRHTIPTRYHNPGDLKSAVIYSKLPGQRALGKSGHVVFENDAAGWAALKDYLSKMVDGRSRRFNADMTLAQVSHIYAGNWRPWLKLVAAELNVSTTIKLRELLLFDALPDIFMTEFQPPTLLELVLPTPPSSVLMTQEDNQYCKDNFQY